MIQVRNAGKKAMLLSHITRAFGNGRRTWRRLATKHLPPTKQCVVPYLYNGINIVGSNLRGVNICLIQLVVVVLDLHQQAHADG